MPFWKSKPKAARGEPLVPMKAWEFLWRTVFEIEHAGHRYAIDGDFFDFNEKIHLYVDGRRKLTQASPASFEVPDGEIQVSMGLYGLTRAHLVLSTGEEQIMSPVPGTAERWRLNVARRYPTLHTWIGWFSWTVLVISLILTIPQLAELILPHLGYDFTSPITLPGWLNTGITIAGVIAGLDRALQLKNHWLLD